jgi:hypothetical protein
MKRFGYCDWFAPFRGCSGPMDLYSVLRVLINLPSKHFIGGYLGKFTHNGKPVQSEQV